MTFAPGHAATPLSVQRDGPATVIDTGVAELRLRLDAPAAPTALAEVPHWLDGVRVRGQSIRDMHARFAGDARVAGVQVEELARGPVFAAWHLTYVFAEPGTSGTAEAVPLMLGKQSFRFAPDRIPQETIARQQRRYEVAVRAVMGDPWIEVVERYHLPREDPATASGRHQYTIALGTDAADGGVPLDTALWSRWFEYDAFGGNNEQLAMPAEPRPAQQGRPFALLQPRWSQGGGAAQECLFTSGGANPAEAALAAPALGVVAAYPSKWVGPYDAVIAARAPGGGKADFTFPLTDGGHDAATGRPQWYGGRCWALLAAPRRLVQGTATIDALIRRHCDWTLTALINRYHLTWPGMGKGGAGPDPGQYLGRRYQCDDVNPTNYGNRRMVNARFEQDLPRRAEFGALAAATGYIYTDLDAWPGWHSGWGPGNPNFHTDKYLAAIFAAVALRDHPDAPAWLAFGRSCLDADLARIVTAPDGVGIECPGYAGYALSLQAKIARALVEGGLGNPLAEDPLIAKTITWHRKLLTPFDRRLGLRHEAPIGDTHRWTSGADFAELIPFYAASAPAVASELRLADALTHATGPGAHGAQDLDWSSQAFAGFGAVLRDRFGVDQESFLAFKAGPVQGHYHDDDLSFHWYHRGTPIALDYNCSYHPRGDHAALHNAVTLGHAGTVLNHASGAAVPALEQPFGPAGVTRFATTPLGDALVAERHIRGLALCPVEPDDSEFGRDYPSRAVSAEHRRLLLMTRHGAGSPFSDYLVLRDEFATSEPEQVNLHLLARDARVAGTRVLLTGQWDQDILVQVVEATDAAVGASRWGYADEWLSPPTAFLPHPGESVADWDRRLPAERPARGWKPESVPREQTGANLARWRALIASTDGAAMMPPPGWTGTWTFGECQRWLRVSSRAGTPVAMVIYPYPRGGQPPVITREGADITITLADGTAERVALSSATGAIIGARTLLAPIPGTLGEGTANGP